MITAVLSRPTNPETVLWQPDDSASHCPLCTLQFSWLQRKHHCRCCGRIVCGSCSNHRRVLANPISPPLEDRSLPLRVCKTCANPPVLLPPSRLRVHENARISTIGPEGMEDTRCPICNMKNPSETHVGDCLERNAWGSPVIRNRMLTWKCEANTDSECDICMEAFEKGQKMSRLECLCVFHNKCIRDWFDRRGNGMCPTHQLDED